MAICAACWADLRGELNPADSCASNMSSCWRSHHTYSHVPMLLRVIGRTKPVAENKLCAYQLTQHTHMPANSKFETPRNYSCIKLLATSQAERTNQGA